MEILLTPRERDALLLVLEEYLGELRTEIIDTDSYDYRLGLKQKETTLKKILRKVQTANSVPVP